MGLREVEGFLLPGALRTAGMLLLPGAPLNTVLIALQS